MRAGNEIAEKTHIYVDLDEGMCYIITPQESNYVIWKFKSSVIYDLFSLKMNLGDSFKWLEERSDISVVHTYDSDYDFVSECYYDAHCTGKTKQALTDIKALADISKYLSSYSQSTFGEPMIFEKSKRIELGFVHNRKTGDEIECFLDLNNRSFLKKLNGHIVYYKEYETYEDIALECKSLDFHIVTYIPKWVADEEKSEKSFGKMKTEEKSLGMER